MCDKSKCSCKKKAGTVEPAVLKKLEDEYAKFCEVPSKSLLKKYLTRDVFNRVKVNFLLDTQMCMFCINDQVYDFQTLISGTTNFHLFIHSFNTQNRKTRYGSSLLDVIQSGLQNPDSGVGIYAADPECYTVFAPLFDPIVEDYHEGFKPFDQHPSTDFGDPSTIPILDPQNKYIISTRVRCARSLENFPFNPTMTKDHYIEIQEKVNLCFNLFYSSALSKRLINAVVKKFRV